MPTRYAKLHGGIERDVTAGVEWGAVKNIAIKTRAKCVGHEMNNYFKGNSSFRHKREDFSAVTDTKH